MNTLSILFVYCIFGIFGAILYFRFFDKDNEIEEYTLRMGIILWPAVVGFMLIKYIAFFLTKGIEFATGKKVVNHIMKNSKG
jgi:hypothetical protein